MHENKAPTEAFREEDDDSREEKKLAREALRHGRKPWYENPMSFWIFQGTAAVMMALVLGYIVFWSDAHNDARYLKALDYSEKMASFMDRYKENRANDKADRDAIRSDQQKVTSDLNKRLDRFEQQQDTMSGDIKTLLRQKP